MQALTVAKPFAATTGAVRASRASRAVAAVRASTEPEAEPLRVPRRAVAGLFAAAPLLLSARSALALIPDDDDEELIEKARANRASRLASERQTEKKFSRTATGIDRVLESELIPVQRAVNSLAESGAQLEAGDVKAVAATLNGAWVRDFKTAATKLSYTDAAKSSADSVFTSLSALEAAAAKGSAGDAKRSFVSAVGALTAWASDANIAADIKGL